MTLILTLFDKFDIFDFLTILTIYFLFLPYGRNSTLCPDSGFFLFFPSSIVNNSNACSALYALLFECAG